MAELAAVCFDLDGTLCVAEQDPERLLDAAFEAAGVGEPFSVADLGAVETGALPTTETQREFFRSYFGAAARTAGAELSDDALWAVVDAYLDLYDDTAVRARDGAVEAVRTAARRHPIGLVTNSGAASASEKLETLGLDGTFDAIVCCDPAGGIDPKPDPTPLQRALGELEVPAGRTLLVGDTLSCDVAGARAVGMRSAWVPLSEPDPEPSPEPTHVLNSMAAVPELF